MHPHRRLRRPLALRPLFVPVLLAVSGMAGATSGLLLVAAPGSTSPQTPEAECPAPLAPCAGDCGSDFGVTVDEIVAAVNVALELSGVTGCRSADVDGDGRVTIDEIVAAVRSALDGCRLEGGAIYEVRACEDERFRIFVVHPETIREAERILAGQEPQKIVTGVLRCGHGNFNGPWGWHLDPPSVGFAEMTIELCDGCPSFIEEDPDYWLGTVGRYCPWSAEVLRRVR